MEALIAEIVQKLYSLSDGKVLKVLDFVESLTGNKERLTLPPLENGVREDEEFEAIADQLADEFKMYVGTVSVLSDYAVSRAGIYEEHP